MQSVFSLFENYEDSANVVDALLEAGFDQDEMNVLVDAKLARSAMDANLERIAIKATDEVGEASQGLDVILGSERPIVVPRLGSVYAAGDIATIMAEAAAAPDTEGLEGAMEEFGVPSPQTCIESIVNGGVLFWIRTEDERVSEAADIFRVYNGLKITSYGG